MFLIWVDMGLLKYSEKERELLKGYSSKCLMKQTQTAKCHFVFREGVLTEEREIADG